MTVTLQSLALSRGTVDRAAHRRTEPGLIDALLHRSDTGVLLLDGDQVPVTDTPDGPQLCLLDPAAAGRYIEASWPSSPVDPAEVAELIRIYLGEGIDGRSQLALVRLAAQPWDGGSQPVLAAADPAPAPAGSRWAGLREVGAALDDTGVGLFTAAAALAHWHARHPCCARCGRRTLVAQAGWLRECPRCTAEHYPRTDAAVIMAVVDDSDRILLGWQPSWTQGLHSCLAGFVEPGESLEAAVRREVMEEAGVRVGEMEYRGSQPWPFPASLMIGFRARAVSTEIIVDEKELAGAGWWSRQELAADLATGKVRLPFRLSIARRLIEEWFGAPLSDGVQPRA